jgi:hypothetical protein
VAFFAVVVPVAIASTGERAPRSQGRATVTGTVYDSLNRRPLAGAMVQFVGASDSVMGRVHSAQSDSAGRYAVAGIAPGRYLAGFFHPLLDSLGVEAGTRAVLVENGGHVLPLAIPSGATIARVLCPAGIIGDSSGALVGRVVSTGSGIALPGATVKAEWNETVISRTGVYQRTPAVASGADSSGWFGLCGLPGDVPLLVRAITATDTSGYVELTAPTGGLRYTTFHVGGVRRATIFAADTGVGASPGDSTLVWARRGDAVVTGRVTDSRGQPMPNARVLVWHAARHTATNDRGQFTLDSLPGGTNTIETRAIGFLPAQAVVHLDSARASEVTLALGERVATRLPAVTVRGQLVYSRKLLAFENRRRTSAVGHFITPADLANRPFNKLSDVLQAIPALVVSSGGVTGIAMRMNQLDGQISGASPMRAIGEARDVAPAHGGQNYCQPVFFIDGQRSFLKSQEIDQDIKADQIAAVEVYTRPASVPPEFFTNMAECGVIAIWTRPPATRIRRSK